MEIWDKHDVLFHSTNGRALERILETQSLHLTHYKYMNDGADVVHLEPTVKGIVAPIVKSRLAEWSKRDDRVAELINKNGGLAKMASSETGKMIDVLYSVTFGENRKHKFLTPYYAC